MKTFFAGLIGGLLVLFSIFYLTGVMPFALAHGKIVNSVPNSLLLEVDLDEGWNRVATTRKEYLVFEKPGPRGAKFIRWEIIDQNPENQKNLRLLVSWEIVALYGSFFNEGNMCRLTEDASQMIGILEPKGMKGFFYKLGF